MSKKFSKFYAGGISCTSEYETKNNKYILLYLITIIW